MYTLYELIGNLERLSTDEIYKLLMQEGCRGERGDASNCPIAKYVQKHTGLPNYRVTVNTQTVFTYKDNGLTDEKYNLNQPISPVTEFINKFDQQRYKDLIG